MKQPFVQTTKLILFSSIQTSLTRATYRNTDTGQLKLAVNAVQQKLRRRLTKIADLEKKLMESKSNGDHLSKQDTSKIKRIQFDYEQAIQDKELLLQEIADMKEVAASKEPAKPEEATDGKDGDSTDGTGKDGDSKDGDAKDDGRATSPTEATAGIDQYLGLLNVDPQETEVHFLNM